MPCGLEELVLVEHAREHAAQLVLVDDRQHASLGDAGLVRQMRVRHEFRVPRHEEPRIDRETAAACCMVSCLEHGRRGQRQQPDHRAHLQARGAAVGQAQHVVEEAVFLVPHLVLALADAVHRGGDPQRSARRTSSDISSYSGSFSGQLERDLEHVLAEERHPGRAVGLLQVAARGQRRAAVEHADVVEPEEAALEHVARRCGPCG